MVSFHLYPDDQLLPLVQAKYSQPIKETVINRHTYISVRARAHTHTHTNKYIHTYIHRYPYTIYCNHIILEWKVQNSKCLQYWQFACNSMLQFSRNFNNIQKNLLKTICHSLFVSMCSEVYSTKLPLTTLLQYIFVKLWQHSTAKTLTTFKNMLISLCEKLLQQMDIVLQARNG